MKKKIVAILLCFCSFLLCGCSEPVEYSIYQDSSNRVCEVTYVPFSASELRLLGVGEDIILQMQSKIIEQVYSYYAAQKESFVKRVTFDMNLTAEDKQLLISQYNNGVEDVYAMVGEVPTAGVVKDTNYIKFALRYDSAICYYMAKLKLSYKQLVEYLSKDDSEIIEALFANKKVSSGKTVFDLQYDENRTLAQYIIEQCRGILDDNTALSDAQIAEVLPHEFLYRYGASSSRVHSNADKTFYSDGVYFHEWTLDVISNQAGAVEIENKEVKTWTTHANKNVWYALALVGGFALVGVLFAVDFFKNKNKIGNCG